MTPNPPPPPPPPQSSGGKKSTGIVFIILGVGFALCCIVGILAAIAIPNFIKFQSRAKQSECKTNLKAYYVAQQAYFQEKNAWGATAQDVGFEPMGTRYTYFTGGAPLPPTMPSAQAVDESQLPQLESPPGIAEDGFTAACAGSIDNDATLDVWTISSKDRTIGGLPVRAGTPHNDVNDVTE